MVSRKKTIPKGTLNPKDVYTYYIYSKTNRFQAKIIKVTGKQLGEFQHDREVQAIAKIIKQEPTDIQFQLIPTTTKKKKQKTTSRKQRLNQAINKITEAKDEIEILMGEISDWKCGMEGTNLECTQKYSDLEECEDALQSLTDNLDEATSEAECIEFPGAFGR